MLMINEINDKFIEVKFIVEASQYFSSNKSVVYDYNQFENYNAKKFYDTLIIDGDRIKNSI